MMNDKARKAVSDTTSTSFACDLKKWLEIMRAYENGGHAYHATMPTDALVKFRDAMKETEAYGFDKSLRDEQQELERDSRGALIETARASTASPPRDSKAPGVVVELHQRPDIAARSEVRLGVGLQTAAAGVPLQCDEWRRFPHLPDRAVRSGQAAPHRSHGDLVERALDGM